MKSIGNSRLKRDSYTLLIFLGFFLNALQAFPMEEPNSSPLIFGEEEVTQSKIFSIKSISTMVGEWLAQATLYLPNAVIMPFTGSIDPTNLNEVMISPEESLPAETLQEEIYEDEEMPLIDPLSTDFAEKLSLEEVKAQSSEDEIDETPVKQKKKKRKKRPKKTQSEMELETQESEKDADLEGWTKVKTRNQQRANNRRQNKIEEVNPLFIEREIYRLLDEGQTLQYNDAAQHFFQALALGQKINNTKLQAEAMFRLGKIPYIDDDHRTTGDWYFDAIQKLKNSDDIYFKAKLYTKLGNFRYKGRHREWLLKAKELLGEDGPPYLRGKLFNSMANVNLTDKDHPQKVDWYVETLDLVDENSEPSLVIEAYIGLAHANYQNKQVEWLLKAKRLLKVHKNPYQLIKVYRGLANAHYQNNEEKWLRKALAIVDIHDKKPVRIQLYLAMGLAEITDEEHPSSLSWVEKAHDLLDEDIDFYQRGQVYLELGRTSLEKSKQAQWYKKVLDLRNQISEASLFDDVSLFVRAFLGLGHIAHEDNQEKWYRTALQLLEKKDNRILRAHIYVAMGDAQIKDKYHEEDTVWYIEALSLLPAIGYETLKARALMGLGNGTFQGMQVEWYLKALKVLKHHKSHQKFRARAMLMLGNAHYEDTEHPESYEWFLDVLKLLGRNGDLELRTRAMLGLGNQCYVKGKYKTPLGWYKEALKLAIECRNTYWQAKVREAMCRYYVGQQNLKHAQEVADQMPAEYRYLLEGAIYLSVNKSHKRSNALQSKKFGRTIMKGK